MEAKDFLARFPPFDALAPDELDDVAGAAELGRFPEGTTILRRWGRPSDALYVVRQGAVELVDDGTVVDLLEEGEVFGTPSLIARTAPTFTVRAAEDTECYVIAREVADRVLRTPLGINFLARALVRRGRQLSLVSEALAVVRPAPAVETLVRRVPVTCDPATTVRAAAAAMSEAGVSSILVVAAEPMGIVTDRDLRAKIVAGGADAGRPVEEMMSSPLVTVTGDASSEEALLLMLERGIHHLPVVGPDGGVLGIVSDTDLMAIERTAPFALLRTIERTSAPDGVAQAMRGVPAAVRALVDAEADPVDIGHLIAGAIDAATRRLVHLAIADLGEPPGPWAWLALGSEARHEQALRTDQDHALVFEPPSVPSDPVDRYFTELARRVTEGLERAGVPRCHGGVMAESPLWRGDRTTWIQRYRSQLAAADAAGTVFSNIALDHRRVAGGLDVEADLDGIVRAAAREGWLVRRLASAAIELRPPTGFFRDFVLESKGSRAGTLDVKHGGITPITNLARAFAVGSGSSATRTIDRLRDAAAAGALDGDLAVGLEEAFRLLWRVRLRHQADQLAAAEEPDDSVDPRSLGPLARRSLKEAFRMIGAAQRHLATTLGLRMH
jgi:CBS domain-containing protein